jgi:hypothetical protein
MNRLAGSARLVTTVPAMDLCQKPHRDSSVEKISA